MKPSTTTREADMTEPYDHDDDGGCYECGGEGFVYYCFEEFACIDPEGGCDMCMRRCDLCRPRKPKSTTPHPSETAHG